MTAADLAGFDAVIDAFGAWAPDTVGRIAEAVQHLCGVLSGTQPGCWSSPEKGFEPLKYIINPLKSLYF